MRSSSHSHRGLCRLGPGGDHDRVDPVGDRLEVVVTHVALDLVGVRVDAEHLVAALAEPPVHDVAAVFTRVPGDPGDRNPSVGEEL
jgi:hypothetical protein